MFFTVAVIGRPNVGKSTLFNRLTGKRLAIVDNIPGVTRDRREGDGGIAGLDFTVIDTAGLDDAGDGSLEARMREQTERALDDADVALFLIDARAGVTPTKARAAPAKAAFWKPMDWASATRSRCRPNTARAWTGFTRRCCPSRPPGTAKKLTPGAKRPTTPGKRSP